MSVTRAARVGLTGALGVLAAVLIVSYQAATRHRDAAAAAASTDATLRAIDQVRLSVREAGLGMRGYVLTGDSAYRGIFNEAAEAMARSSARLSTLRGDRPSRRAELPPLLLRAASVYDSTMRLRDRAGVGAARDAVSSGATALLADSIAGLLRAMTAQERTWLNEHNAAAARASDLTTDGILLATVAALLAIGLAGIATARELRASRRAHGGRLASEAALRSEGERLAAMIATQQLVASTSSDLSGAMRTVTDRVLALTAATGVGIALRDGHDLVFEAGSGTVATEVGLRLGLTSSLVGLCCQRGELLTCQDTETEPAPDPDVCRRLQLRSAVLVPLLDDGAVIGVLAALSSHPRHFGERDARTLQLIAGLLSAGLARAAALEAREAALLALQDSEERYRSAVAALHEGIALVQADGAVQPVNESVERLLAPLGRDGLPLNLFERPWHVLKEDGTPYREDELPFVVTLCTGRPIAGAILGVPGDDGLTVWLTVNCVPLWRGDQALPYAAVASFTDTTARRRAEEALDEARQVLEQRVRERTADLAAELGERQRTEGELRQAHDELEMRVHERTANLILVNRSLQEAKDAAELANVTKSRFLANMSHELRTPLNSVIGFANILLKNRQNTLSAQDLGYLGRIQENGSHLLGLINDILDLSKIEAGRLEPARTPVNLSALVGELVRQIGGQLVRRSVRLESEVPAGLAAVETDPSRLKQVLFNLVGNALKFTHNGRVTVRVTGDPDTGRPLTIEVSDTGIGIPADRHEAVFEVFQQADNTTERRYGGTGLGLSISRSLLQAMGYRLTFESRVGEGSTFTIHLDPPVDMAGPSLPPARARAPTDAPFDGRRILVIDDASDSRSVLRQYLEDLGCEVRATDGGPEGLAGACTWRPHLITLDLRLPGMYGDDVLRRLAAEPELAAIPVVVISVLDGEYRERPRGAAYVLDKPVSRESLREALAPRLQAV